MSLINMMAIGGGTLKLDYSMSQTYLATTFNKPTKSHSFTGVSFGVAHGQRMVAILIANAHKLHTTQVSTVTIGGIPATVFGTLGNGAGDATIAYTKVPTGTSGTVVVTMDDVAPGTQTQYMQITAHRFNTRETTALDSVRGEANGTNQITLPNIQCVKGGIVLAIHASENNENPTFSWNGTDSVVYDTTNQGVANNLKARRGHVLSTEDSTVRDLSLYNGVSGNKQATAISFRL